MRVKRVSMETFTKNEIDEIKKEFKIFSKKENRNLIYLDSAATSQKPNAVIEEIISYYTKYNSNAERSGHRLGMEATNALNEARKAVAKFLNVNEEEIIFTKGATEGLNLVASTYGRQNIQRGDEVVSTILEHHANFVPWQQLCIEKDAIFSTIDLDEKNRLNVEQLLNKIEYSSNLKIITITAESNVTGEIIDLERIIRKAHEKNIKVVVDGSQIVSHKKIDLKKYDCDFFAFSGHKMFGPMGIGILFAKKELLEDMMPYQYRW